MKKQNNPGLEDTGDDVLLAERSKKASKKKSIAELSAEADNQQKEPPLIPSVRFLNLLLHEVIPDPNQPRHYFNEADEEDLMNSVREKGVLQPILVRPIELGNFMIVCGERRYRAALRVNGAIQARNTIPATIRHLTDDEALEIQIIENLQRKDVQPMEEAVAFQSLRGRMEVEEISLKVGKSPKYVAQRIQLTNLIADLQEMLSQHKMKLVQAYKLCRLSATSQQSIYKEVTRNNDHWRKNKSFQLFNIDHYASRELLDLDKATFKTKDPLLYPEIGACTTCPFNTANSPLLFDDLNKKRFCNNPVCYQVKTSKAYQQNIQKVLANPDVLVISTPDYLHTEDKQKIKSVEEMGVTVLMHKMFDVLIKPEPVSAWEDYLKENDDWSDEEDLDEEEKLNSLENCRGGYQEEIDGYLQELKVYEQQMSSGLTKKAFVVVGNYEAKEGQLVDVIINPKKGVSLPAGMTASGISKQVEIASIKQREIRNEELDREKVYKLAMAELKEPFTSLQDPLHPEEFTALAMLIAQTAYAGRDFLKQELNLRNDDTHLQEYNKLQELRADSPLLTRLIRIALYKQLIDFNQCDYAQFGRAAALFAIARLWIPDRVKEIEAAQMEKTVKRKDGVNKRLKALETE